VVTTKKPKLTGWRRHALVERVSIFGAKARLGPLGLIQYAQYYLDGARSVQPSQDTLPVVRTFLAARAVELALKAFLAVKGNTLVELAGGLYGHDLKQLIAEADKRDLQAIVKLTDEQHAGIIKASEYYLEKVLEYPSVSEAVRGYRGMPNADILIGTAAVLIERLYEPCVNAE